MYGRDSGKAAGGRIAEYEVSFKICLIYAALGTAWILFSDRLAAVWAADMTELQQISIYKGWAFIFVTTVLLYFLVRRFWRQILSANQRLYANNQELEAAYEEIAATEEELRSQYEELEIQSNAVAISEQKYRALFENMLNAFALHEIICDDSGKPVDYRFLNVNPAFERLTGLKKEAILGKTILEVLPDTEQYWLEEYGKVAITGQSRRLIRFSRELGRYFEVEAYCPEPGKFAVQFLDSTERIEYQEDIEYMAYHDALTNLPNRYLFRERLRNALERAAAGNEKLAVVVLDLDDFKLVNDSLGHFAGDELLKVISERLLSSLRGEDTIARLGGDEFTIMLENIESAKTAAAVAEKIITAVEEPWYYNGSAYHVTCKLGISLFPEDGQDADTLMKQADIAMYKAQEKGKGYYQYFMAGMEAEVARRLELEADLRKAVTGRQFVLYYQPQVDFGGRIVGVEALLRWRHPQKGLIAPMEFIPIAEENGSITRIGEWVLKTACEQAKAWQDAGLPPVFMAVNLSGRQFHQRNLLQVISGIIEQAGLSPRWLTLEITETVAMQNADYTVQVLGALKSMGVQIALDDFGIGYSSLKYLKRFPLNSLKIDRSFIHDVSTNSDGAIIAKTILTLGKSLKYTVVAEGVETAEQLDFLRDLECDCMQGYIFSKPLPAAEITEMLARFAGGDS